MIIGQVAIELAEFNLHLSRHVSDRLLGRHIAMHRDGLAAGASTRFTVSVPSTKIDHRNVHTVLGEPLRLSQNLAVLLRRAPRRCTPRCSGASSGNSACPRR